MVGHSSGETELNTTRHLQLEIDQATQDYHRVLRAAVMRLVHECQQRAGRNDLAVLDVGCGRGELLADLVSTGAKAQGVDLQEECVALSRQYADACLGNIYELPTLFGTSSFDVVIASHVLEHLESPRQGVEMLKQVTRKWLILAVPNLAEFRNLRWRQNQPGFVNRDHQVGWDPAHFNTFLTYACGVQVERWEPDRVYPPRRIVPLLRASGLLHKFMDNWLPARLPLQSHSLIVLGTVPDREQLA